MRGVVDAGHGAPDPGAQALGVTEADVNLEVSNRLAEILDGAGHNVVRTRVADYGISLADRIATMEELADDFVVSVHCNAATSINATGHEVWYQEGDPSSEDLAASVSTSLSTLIPQLPSRGIKPGSPATRSNWYTFQAGGPGDILVELFFVTNQDDVDTYHGLGAQPFAVAIADGLAQWATEEGEPMTDDVSPIAVRTGTWGWPDVPDMPHGTPVGDVAYVVGASPGHSVEDTGARLVMLSQNGWRCVYRLDFAGPEAADPTTAPRDEADNQIFLDGVERAFAVPGFGAQVAAGSIMLSAFNEPNNPAEGGHTAQSIAGWWNGYGRPNAPENTFVAKVRAERFGGLAARLWLPAGNAFGSANEDGELLWGGRNHMSGTEASPWAQWYADLVESCVLAVDDRGWTADWLGSTPGVALGGFLDHCYGRADWASDPKAEEPFQDLRDDNGWRFGSRILVTWKEVREALGFRDPLVWITETNTMATPGDWPADNYPTGWLGNFRDFAVRQHGGALDAVLWFSGPTDGGPWDRTAVTYQSGRMPRVLEELRAIQIMEDTDGA